MFAFLIFLYYNDKVVSGNMFSFLPRNGFTQQKGDALYMSKIERNASWLHYTLAFIGGFLGVYAILTRSDFFGSAQTANLIFLVKSILGRNVYDAALRLGAMLIYMLAIGLTVWLPEHTHVDIRKMSVAVDVTAILILGFLPEKMNPILALYPIFFSMAFQWNSFKGARGYSSSTIFSTNNLRQFTVAATEVLFNHRKEQKDKALFFGGTLLSFHLGVAVSYLLWLSFRVREVFFALVPVAVAAALVLRQERLEDAKGAGQTICLKPKFSHLL